MIVIYFALIDGYLDGWSSTPSYAENEISLTVDKGHEVLQNPEIFKLVDGELTKDEERQRQLVEEQKSKDNELSKEDMNALAIMELAEMIMGGGV